MRGQCTHGNAPHLRCKAGALGVRRRRGRDCGGRVSAAAAAVLPVTSHKTREAPEMVVMGQGLLDSGQTVEQPSLQPRGGREIRISHRWRQRRCRRSPPGRTTPAGFVIGSAKSASGERETSRPSRAAVALACIDAPEEPSAVRASTLQAVRPVVARELDLPGLRSWVVKGARIWSSTSSKRRTSMSGGSCAGRGTFRRGCGSRSRTGHRRYPRRASERERQVQSGAPFFARPQLHTDVCSMVG